MDSLPVRAARAELEERLALSHYGEIRRIDRKGYDAYKTRKVEMAELALRIAKERFGIDLPLLTRFTGADGKDYVLNVWAELHESKGRPTEDEHGS